MSPRFPGLSNVIIAERDVNPHTNGIGFLCLGGRGLGGQAQLASCSCHREKLPTMGIHRALARHARAQGRGLQARTLTGPQHGLGSQKAQG